MINMHKPALNPRLKKIADLVPQSGTVADIGTDHAYIPVYLVKSGKAQRAIASDIKKGPVERAQRNVEKYNMQDYIDIRLGAGLETIGEGEADVIIIAGMGGILISNILSEARKIVSSSKLLILQPMTAVPELRSYLCENGFQIMGEYLETEGDKIYNIITASPCGNTDYSMKEIYIGRGLEDTSGDLYREYRRRVEEKIKKRLRGLRRAETEQNNGELENLTKILKKICEEQ